MLWSDEPEIIDPKQFYKGADGGWSAIEQALDVRRHLTDNILSDYFIGEASPDDPNVQLLVVKAHAGAGKSVLLRRLAWDATREFEKLCLFVRPEGLINASAIGEIAELTNETVYLFVDSVIERRREVELLFGSATNIKGKVTVVSTARTGMWNQAPDSLTSLATEEYDLPYLSNTEIDKLLKLLETHKALGRLEQLNPEKRREELHERAGRQLLVALHEATLGKPFELIIADEYEHITPPKAQQMYLTVCLLNQFGLPVRAGIISRQYGVPFEEFRKSFFAPLEQIIIAKKDRISGDFCYSARHSHIAEIVIHTALAHREDLFNEIVKTIQFLNPGYKSDWEAFRRLIQGRTLLEQFPDHQMVVQIYDAAHKVAGEDAFLLQQMAIYEMHRPNGSLLQAEKQIKKALDLSRNSRTIQHTLAELLVREAESSANDLEKDKYLSEASKICHELKGRMAEAYPFYTLAKIGIIRIRQALNEENVNDQTLENLIRSTEKELSDGQQRFPENAYLRAAEAELAEVLSRSEKALTALRKAFELNHRNPFIAIRLADCYNAQGKTADAVEVLRKALDAKRGDHKLNYYFARMLLETGKGSNDDILYHLERGYVPGDQNYDAQFLHARQLFVMDRRQDSYKLFRRLKQARIPPSLKNAIRHPLNIGFAGSISQMEVAYCWINRDGDGEAIHVRREDVDGEVWSTLSTGTRVTFKIGFNMHGPAAYEVAKE